MAESNVVGKRLAIAISKSGKTQTEVGRWLDVSPQAVNGWISRKSLIKLEDAAVIAKGLGVSLDWLALLFGLRNAILIRSLSP